MKHTAAFAFTAACPGRMLFMICMCSIHPVSTHSPKATESTLQKETS
jgi:hypothetical protein